MLSDWKSVINLVISALSRVVPCGQHQRVPTEDTNAVAETVHEVAKPNLTRPHAPLADSKIASGL